MRERDALALAAALATALTSSALFAVFTSARFLPAVLGMVAVVAAGSVLGRRLRVPPYVGPLLTGGLGLLYLVVVFARADAIGGLIPGPGALRLLLARTEGGFTDIQSLAPPVPTYTGIVLIATGGVGLVALAADVLAATLRRPALAGLPLLALFTVPAAIAVEGAGIVPFALAVTGYLLLLAADNRHRLARWGRPLRTTGQLEQLRRLTAATYGEEQPTGAMGRRIGLGAIGLALVVPLVLPTLRGPIFDGNGLGGNGTGSGSGGVTTYNPILRLKDQLTRGAPQPMLLVTTTDTSSYLRMAGLDAFDGRTWSQSPLRAGRDQRLSVAGMPTPSLDGEQVSTGIRVTDALDARWMPLPYQPTVVNVAGDWRYENKTGTVFSTRETLRRLAYSVESRRLNADPKALDAAVLSANEAIAMRDYLSYPEDLPAVIAETVEEITAEATTPYRRAVAIQNFFRSPSFSYSLTVPQGNSQNAIANFLEVRQGYCEQFAASMALFARVANIPSRVAIGFSYGARSASGEHVITTHDAHAWPELYFPGAGWLPFEPTPRAGAGQQPTVPQPYTAGVDGEGAAARPDANRDAEEENAPAARADRLGPNPNEDDDGAAVLAPDEASTGGWGAALRYVAAALVAAAVLATPSLLRVVTRRRRWRAARTAPEQAHAAWADLRDDAHDLGMVWPASASPRGAAEWLRARAGLSTAAGAALDSLVTAEERARYRRQGADSGWGAELRRDAATVRRALGARLPARRRLLAQVLPVSSIERLRSASGRALAAGDRYERSVARWMRTLLRRRATMP